MERKSFRIWGSHLLVLFVWVFLSQCKGHDQGAKEATAGMAGAKDSLPQDLAAADTAYGNASEKFRSFVLADGSSVLLGPHSVIRMAKTFNTTDREIRLDGEAVFTVSNSAGKPFIIHTRQLKIEVLGTRFYVDAFTRNEGEEVDVFSGKVKASKSYHSTTDNEPETMGPGEMVMINRTIDLMEKETLKPEELKQLQEKW